MDLERTNRPWFSIFYSICGLTPLELAVSRGSVEKAEVLLRDPALSGGLAELRLRLYAVARHLPHWPKTNTKDNAVRETEQAGTQGREEIEKEEEEESENERKDTRKDEAENGKDEKKEKNEDGLDVLRSLIPPELKPKNQDVIGDIPYNWLTFYQIKVMCLNANTRSQNATSQRSMELLLNSQGFDSFMRNYCTCSILLATIIFVFGLIIYVSFRLRAFGWLDVPISMADFLPGAFSPQRLADADFDPSRQRKQLPYQKVPHRSKSCPSFTEVLSYSFKALLGIYASWLLICVRIPPEKDAFDEEYLTDDDEECRLKVRDSCAMKAKHVGSIETIARALSLGGLHFWLIYAGRYSDLFLLDFLYLAYAWLVSTMAGIGEEGRVCDDTGETVMDPVDAASTVTAIFGVQHGPRWARAQCTTRSTAAPNKAKRRRRRRGDLSSGNEKGKAESKRDQHGQQESKGESKGEEDPQKDDRAKDEDSQEKAEKEEHNEKFEPKNERFEESEVEEPKPPALPSPSSVTFSDRFQRQLLNAGVMHVNHSSMLELTVVSICSCFLAIVFLFHLRWICTSSLGHFYKSEAVEVVKAYGFPDSIDRGLAISAEMLLTWLCFERLYDMSTVLHAATLTIKQRNAALRFLREHQPPWPVGREVSSVTLQQATKYFENVANCSEFALELSDARWHILVKPVEFLVSLTELLLVAALLLILLPIALPPCISRLAFLSQKQQALGLAALASSDPILPLTLGLVMVSPTVHTLLYAHFANGEVQRQQSILRSRAEFALSKSPLKQEEDVEYVQLRNRSRETLSKALLKWSNGRALGVVEPIMVLYFALLVVGLATITRLNFIIL
ncbi:unnamed protein product [Durusdinium trenchii]